jgi:glycosyl transferase, family 25
MQQSRVVNFNNYVMPEEKISSHISEAKMQSGSGTPLLLLVSLESDHARREALAARFPMSFPDMLHVASIDGCAASAIEYYSHLFPAANAGYRLLAPAEVGCALSHVEALRCFLRSDKAVAIVLEDDVLGADEDMKSFVKEASSLEGAEILFGGGQPRPFSRYIWGREKREGVWELAQFSQAYVARACAYAVTRPVAEAILQAQGKVLRLADDWQVLLPDDVTVYMGDWLSHSEDLSKSRIEVGRSQIMAHRGPWLKRKSSAARRRWMSLLHRARGYQLLSTIFRR